MRLEKGDKIYYGGDAANLPGIGIVKRAYSDKWGSFVDVEFEDGRKKKRLSLSLFSEKYDGTGLTKFVKLEAYRKWKERKIKELMARIGK